jgi:hypothetical protein
MSNAHYSVIRYIPDLGRGESLNVGILLWNDAHFSVELDEKAIQRVIRENPRLERDALLYVAPLLRERLSDDTLSVPQRVKRMLDSQRGYPIDLTAPRCTTVNGTRGWEAELRNLTSRIVVPKRRTSGGPRAIDLVERGLRSLLQTQAVSRNHFFSDTRTGVSRRADFYANSTANIALDVLGLSLRKADNVRQKADAEAMKVYDVLGGPLPPSRYVVFCDFGSDVDEGVNDDARKVIESQGATIVTNADEATRTMTRAVKGLPDDGPRS